MAMWQPERTVRGPLPATRDDVDEKNRLCPPVVFTGWPDDLLSLARAGRAQTARTLLVSRRGHQSGALDALRKELR